MATSRSRSSPAWPRSCCGAHQARQDYECLAPWMHVDPPARKARDPMRLGNVMRRLNRAVPVATHHLGNLTLTGPPELIETIRRTTDWIADLRVLRRDEPISECLPRVRAKSCCASLSQPQQSSGQRDSPRLVGVTIQIWCDVVVPHTRPQARRVQTAARRAASTTGKAVSSRACRAAALNADACSGERSRRLAPQPFQLFAVAVGGGELRVVIKRQSSSSI